MTISMYQASVPVFNTILGSLSAIIDKAVSHAEVRKIDPAVLVNARLYPDMLPFTAQVQIACDMAKFGAGRLSGAEIPKHDDSEATFSELKARIAQTLAFVGTVKPEQIDGTEDKTVTIKLGGEPTEFKGQAYLLHFVLPNFYFHVATAYDILRHNGVELSKRDFLGQF